MSTSTQTNNVADQNTVASSQAVDTTSSSTSMKIGLTSAGAITTAFLEVMKSYSTMMNYINELLQKEINCQGESVTNSYKQAVSSASEQRDATYFQAGVAFATTLF